MAEGLFLVMLLFTVGVSLLLYYLVRTEHEQRETMNRRAAERTARRDIHDRK